MYRAFLFLCLGLLSTHLFAANLHDATQSFEGLLDLVKNNANNWNARLRQDAQYLFWSLVIIQMVWKFGLMAIRKPDMSEFTAELFRFLFVVGIFAGFLTYSVEWATVIVASFRQAAANAAGMGTQLTPGDMFGIGVEMAKTVSDIGVGLLNPATAILTAVSALIILVCFAFIAAFLQVLLIESYIVINASVFFMAFGGSEWTRDYAMAMFRYSISVGAQLFVLTLLVGIVMASAQDWRASYQNQPDQVSMLTFAGLALVCAYLVKRLADIIHGLITGTSTSGGSVLGGMASVMAAGVAGGIAMAAAKMGGLSSMMGGGTGGVSDLMKSGFSGGSSAGGSMMGGSSSPGGSDSYKPSSRIGGGSSLQGASAAPAPSGAKPAAAGSTSKVAHTMADLAVRGMGAAMAVSVPGAEDAAGLSLGTPPQPTDTGLQDSPQDTPENVIRPAEQPEEKPVVDTMSGLRETLNNRGKKQ